MPTNYTDQFYLLDPANPPSPGTAVNFVQYTATDANDDGDLDRFNNDSLNGSDIRSSWPGDTVTINVPGIGNVTYTGTTFYLANGQRVFTPTDGQVLKNGTFVSSSYVTTQGPLLVGDLGPACFTLGTRIRTPGGDVAIETLAPGDLVLTEDHGPQPLRWIGRREVEAEGDFAPIRIARGAMGNGRTLFVSPMHRMLVRGWRAELLFGEAEVLVSAKFLVGTPGIRRAPMPRVTYLHLLFDRHEIVLAEGAPSESFHPGSILLDGDRAVLGEIAAIFPELLARRREGPIQAARRVISAREARLLAA
ncbi:Hint domain-containing protein [Albidovulum sp.]